jgi:hypothetical protein
LFGFLVSEEFIFLLFFEDVDFFVLVLVVTVIGRGSILGFPAWELRLSRRQVQGIVVLDAIFLVLVDDFRDLLDSVSCHLAKMVLYFELSRVFFRGERQVEVVFVVPIETLEAELLLSQDLLSEDT